MIALRISSIAYLVSFFLLQSIRGVKKVQNWCCRYETTTLRDKQVAQFTDLTSLGLLHSFPRNSEAF